MTSKQTEPLLSQQGMIGAEGWTTLAENARNVDVRMVNFVSEAHRWAFVGVSVRERHLNSHREESFGALELRGNSHALSTCHLRTGSLWGHGGSPSTPQPRQYSQKELLGWPSQPVRFARQRRRLT
jgi:hypothetical protein